MARVRQARSEEQKAERSAALTRAARTLFAEMEYSEVPVQRIAREAGVAKGTVFLYFATKEALGLAVLTSMLRDWWADVHGWLERLERPATPSSVAAAVRRSLDGREDLHRMLGLTSVLEANAGSEAVVAFRREMRDGAGRIGRALEGALPFLRAGEGLEAALTMHALLIGIQHMASGRPDSEPQEGRTAAFRVDVPGALGRTLRIQLEGAKALSKAAAAPRS